MRVGSCQTGYTVNSDDSLFKALDTTLTVLQSTYTGKQTGKEDKIYSRPVHRKKEPTRLTESVDITVMTVTL